jgi:hypothetical protein
MLRGWGLRIGLLWVGLIWRLEDVHKALDKWQLLFNWEERRRDLELEAMMCHVRYEKERGEIVNSMMISKHNDRNTRKLHNNNNSAKTSSTSI